MTEPIDAAALAAFPIALERLPGVGRRTVAAVLRAFPSSQAFEHASEQDLELALGGRAAQTVRRGMDDGWAPALRGANDVIDLHKGRGIEIVSMLDPRYPSLLRVTDDPPVVLFVKGNPALLDAPLTCAVVGTRTP